MSLSSVGQIVYLWKKIISLLYWIQKLYLTLSEIDIESILSEAEVKAVMRLTSRRVTNRRRIFSETVTHALLS